MKITSTRIDSSRYVNVTHQGNLTHSYTSMREGVRVAGFQMDIDNRRYNIVMDIEEAKRFVKNINKMINETDNALPTQQHATKE